MSNKVKELLQNLGVENVDETLAELLNDESQNETVISDILKVAQTYAKPFLETEFNEKFNNERTTLKGKYFKDALLKANKTFGNKLTNKEIEEILNNPENAGKTIDVALEVLKEKVSEKTGVSESQLQQMLDSANAKIQEYEAQIPTIESKYKTEYENELNKFKIDGVVSTKLVKILEGKTTIPVEKAMKIIKNELSEKAILKLKEDGNLALYDIAKPDSLLKKNDTAIQDLDSLVLSIVDDLGMTKQSNGTQQVNTATQTTQQQQTQPTSSTGLEAKLAQAIGI